VLHTINTNVLKSQWRDHVTFGVFLHVTQCSLETIQWCFRRKAASVFRVESGERSTAHVGNIRWDYTAHWMWLSKSTQRSWVHMVLSWNDSHKTRTLSRKCHWSVSADMRSQQDLLQGCSTPTDVTSPNSIRGKLQHTFTTSETRNV